MKDELFTYRRNALLNNLCKEWDEKWALCKGDKESLMRLAMNQQSLPHVITYCNNGKGVSKEYILQEFGHLINGRGLIRDADEVDGYTYQMYVAFSDICSLPDDVSAFLWCNCPSVEIRATACPILYIGCHSDIHVTLNGYNSIRIYLFDDSSVTIADADNTCNVTIYKYSDKASVEKGKYCLCTNVKTFEKELRL